MDLEVAFNWNVCRYVLVSGIYFKNGSMRCTHYCGNPLNPMLPNLRCSSHPSLRQRYPTSIREEDLEKYDTEWNIFLRMRQRDISIVARYRAEENQKPDEQTLFDFCHASDFARIPGMRVVSWREIVDNPGAMAWLRDYVAKVI